MKKHLSLLFLLHCFDSLIQIGQIHCLVCSSFAHNRKFCSMAYQQLGYPWPIAGSQQLVYFIFFDHDDPVNGQCTQSDWHLGSKDSRIWFDEGHLICVIALNSFHLNPYDNITQGSGEYSSKTIYTQSAVDQVTQRTNVQRTSLDEFWGHCINGRANVQESPTALTINSDLGFVLRSTPMSKWIRAQEGSLLKHPRLREPQPGMLAGWLLVSEELASLLCHTLFCI